MFIFQNYYFLINLKIYKNLRHFKSNLLPFFSTSTTTATPPASSPATRTPASGTTTTTTREGTILFLSGEEAILSAGFYLGLKKIIGSLFFFAK